MAEDRLNLPLLTAAEMRDWDRAAISGRGVPERVLMEAAGRGAARLVQRIVPRGLVMAAVGGGNNGGDALVLLRCLRAWGRDVLAVPLRGGEDQAELLHGWDIPSVGPAEAGPHLRAAAVLVDGILGTGAAGAPRTPADALIREMNGSGTPIVALDGPSGVDLTTGRAAGEAIRAACTIAFGAAKRGHLLHPGRVHAGRLLVLEIGLPPLENAGSEAALITPEWATAALPQRSPNLHKGAAGSVLLVAGRRGMAGAAMLAGLGALRAGTGVLRIVSDEPNRVPIQARLPEAIFLERESEELGAAIAAAGAIVAGPGMGTDGRARQLLERILGDTGTPLLLDADAITLLARHPDLREMLAGSRAVLTPHPGEAARLLEAEVEEIVADPFGAAERLVERCGCAVLLKGTPSLVAAPGARTLVSAAGHSGLATGGMGDTLAGVAGAFMAAGVEPREAAALALHYSGRAAEIAGRGRALLPRDVAEALPQALSDSAPSSGRSGDVLLDLPAAY